MLSPSIFLSSLVVALAATVSPVSAHGWVRSITLDGVTYAGADPYGSAISSPIRQVSSNSPASPVYGDINGAAMACGGGAKAASMTVPVMAGSDVSVYWGAWPHNVGPIMTYLGACNGDCSTTDPSLIDFFKIHEVAFQPGTHTWVQSQTLYKGLPFNFTLPEDLPSGDFIMRHEVIALHNAQNAGGAEIFPQCIQITVDCGSGVIPNVTARFPGGYSASDPGILINVYNDASHLVYNFPGPDIALEEDMSDDDASSSSSSSSITMTTSATTSDSASSASTTTSSFTSSTASSTTTSSTTTTATTSTKTSTGASTSSTSSTRTSATSSASSTTTSTTSKSSSASTSKSTTTTTSMKSSTTTTKPVSTTKTTTTISSTKSTTAQPSNTPVSVDLQNGRDAIALNQVYQARVAGTSCTNNAIGCIGDSFGQCVWGTWVATKCPAGTVCAALPNVGGPGTSIACTWASDRDARIAATGANLRMRRHRRRYGSNHR